MSFENVHPIAEERELARVLPLLEREIDMELVLFCWGEESPKSIGGQHKISQITLEPSVIFTERIIFKDDEVLYQLLDQVSRTIDCFLVRDWSTNSR